MVLQEPLTPETFLEAPRRGVIAPNRTGTLGLYSVSMPELGSGQDTWKEWRVMDLSNGTYVQVIDDQRAHDAIWDPMSDDVVVWLTTSQHGVTEMFFTYLDDGGSCVAFNDSVRGQHTIPGPVQGMRLKALANGKMAVTVIGLADKDGALYNPDDPANKPLSSARVYDDINVREWDTYIKPQKYSIFYSLLTATPGTPRTYTLAPSFKNALSADTTGLEAPGDMYGGRDLSTSRYDIGAAGIVFTARDPNLDPTKPQFQMASDVYFVSVPDWSSPPTSKPVKIALQGDKEDEPGMASNPRFSPDGSMVAYLKRPFSNEADGRLCMGHVSSRASFDVWKMVVGGEGWDLVPEGFEYSPTGGSLFLTADNCGRVSLFELELRHGARPRLVTGDGHGSVAGFYPFVADGKTGEGGGTGTNVLVSGSSHVETSLYALYGDGEDSGEPVIVSAATLDGKKMGLLHRRQVSDIWFEGSGDTCVQAWMVKPSAFDEGKKWPLVVMVHGGPEAAWHDEWHWRWNAALWAERGYIVVQPNIAGSTGFGVAFTGGVYNQWGGRPYRDLVCLMEHLATVEYIDIDRAVVAGGSYGGYMVNWILGQPLAKKFKAAISHDSVFDLTNSYLYSDFMSGTNDMGGPGLPWLNSQNMDRWNPARPDLLAKWKEHNLPTLFIHSDRDYRCPVTDGYAAFKALRCQGVAARFLTFPDENHFVLKPENALVWHQTVFEWMERWVGKGPTEEVARANGGERAMPQVEGLVDWWNGEGRV